MTNSVDQLFRLQSVDLELRALRLELAALESAADGTRSEASARRTDVEARRLEMAELERRRRDLEGRLADEEAKTKDRRMRMQRIRSDKELGALKREVDLGKEMIGHLEEELLKLLEGAEGKAAELEGIEKLLAETETVLAERERQLEERRQELAAELSRLESERGTLASALEDDVRRRYELVLARKGGVALVEVRKEGDCGGCRVRVPPQLITQIYRKDGLVSCPSCHRILYVASAPAVLSGE